MRDEAAAAKAPDNKVSGPFIFDFAFAKQLMGEIKTYLPPY